MPQIYRLIFTIILFLYGATNNAFAFSCYSSPYGLNSVKKDSTVKKDTNKNSQDEEAKKYEFVLKPIIGVGTGMFSYYGNVVGLHSKMQNPMTARVGYDLMFAQKLTPVIEFNLYALFGKLSVNERTTTVNWNFLSEIRGGGMHLLFKILPKQNLTPYVLTGIESFEYLSKSDLRDNTGNPYYYWSDGSIRSLPQNAPNAASASILTRDYTYDADMRSLDIGGSGKYSLQTYAIPLGAGFMFHLTPRADFLIGTTLHYTFTRHIDGMGDSTGGVKHDMFLMSSIALRFDISGSKRRRDTTAGYLPENLEDVDFTALMNDDYDHDGVRDWDDSCAGTPKGVAVDAKGCPIDGDKDGVPDYLDKELNSPKGAVVNSDGIALTDSMMLREYQIFMDSTGAFAQIIEENKISAAKKAAVAKKQEPTKYTVQLGRFAKGIPPDVMDKLLSIPDVKSNIMPDSSTVYTVGDYTDFASAQSRQQQFTQNGLPDAKVVYRKGNDFIPTNGPVQGTPNNNQVNNNQPNNNLANNNQPNNNQPNNNQPNNNQANNNQPNNNQPNNNQPNNNQPNNNQPNNNQPNNNQPNNNQANNNQPNNIPASGGIVYRIQLGAYSHKLSRDVFSNVNNLVEVKTENGYYTYSAGSFTNYQDAVNYKTQLLTEGFPDAFIKAYQNGTRVPLNKAGATYVKPVKEDMNEAVTHETNTLDKTQISFSVQVGVFRGAPPKNLADKYKQLSSLHTDQDSTGLTHYLVGHYSNPAEAKAMRDKLANDPILKGSFVVAYFKDKPIPVSQAISILKQ